MTKKEKIVNYIMIVNSFFLTFVSAMNLYSDWWLWPGLCLVAAILELGTTVLYCMIAVKSRKRNQPPLS